MYRALALLVFCLLIGSPCLRAALAVQTAYAIAHPATCE